MQIQINKKVFDHGWLYIQQGEDKWQQSFYIQNSTGKETN